MTISLWGKEQKMIWADKHLFSIDKLHFIVLLFIVLERRTDVMLDFG